MNLVDYHCDGGAFSRLEFETDRVEGLEGGGIRGFAPLLALM